MQSKATTVAAYLAALPPDRRAALEAVRAAIRKNLDADIEEGMQYGMIGYYVPHEVFAPGYHCDPKQPLPYAGLASQKGHMSLYMMGLYIGEGSETSEIVRWFQDAWAKTGRKLDMGKACVRFKKIEDVPLEVVGEAIRRVPAKLYIARYLTLLGDRAPKPAAKAAQKSGAKSKATSGAKSTTKSPAKPKTAAKSATKSAAKTGATKKKSTTRAR